SGHPFARIAAKDLVANHATRTLDVTFLVQEGKVATFGTFTVSGTQRLKPDFVEERIDIRPGEPYSPERLAKLRKRLAEYEGMRGKAGEMLDLDVDLRNLPLALAALADPKLDLSGTLTGTAKLSGPAAAPSGNYDLTISRMSKPDLARAGVGPL